MMPKKLFEPVSIGKMMVENRIVMPPMHSTFVSEFGGVTKKLIDYYEARAKGGVGLIVVENACIDWPIAKVSPTVLRIDDNKFIYGLYELVTTIHKHGVKTGIQLHHVGRQTTLANTEGLQPLAPSPIPVEEYALYAPEGYPVPKALTLEEIEGVEKKFVEAARRAKQAGFDSVEIHGAHGYIFSQFISPKTNRRTDIYGGSLKNRARFAVEVVEKIKQKLGDYPIIFKLSADEYVEGGTTLEDSKKVVKWLEDAGVDSFCVSAGTYESRYMSQPCYDMPFGIHLPLAEELKKAVNVPIIAVGKMNWELAEKAIEDGKADLVAFGRPLLADADLPKKIAEGRFDDIRPCVYCNEGCQGRQWLNLPCECDVNYEHGREATARIQPAERAKKVLVVGGGPGGLEAARVAALRGHEVTLCEKEGKLGGRWVVASSLPFKKDCLPLITYYINQLNKLNVKVQLGKRVTPDYVEEVGPDVVIVATGALPVTPDIPGVDLPNVLTADDILTGKGEVGGRIAVAGGGRVGCETAWLLSEKDKDVTVIEQKADIVTDLNPCNRDYLLKKFDELKIKVLTRTYVTSIYEKGIDVVDHEWNRYTIEVDNVVLAMGYVADSNLFKELKRIGKWQVYAIGDCVEPRVIRDAIYEGSSLAREI